MANGQTCLKDASTQPTTTNMTNISIEIDNQTSQNNVTNEFRCYSMGMDGGMRYSPLTSLLGRFPGRQEEKDAGSASPLQ